MNEQLDLILKTLYEGRRDTNTLSFIRTVFQDTGYGSPEGCLQKLREASYIEVLPDEDTRFKLNERGESLRLNGGFVRQATVAQEKRVALILSLLCLLLLITICFSAVNLV